MLYGEMKQTVHEEQTYGRAETKRSGDRGTNSRKR